MKRRYVETERLDIPAAHAEMAHRRVAGIIRACCHEENILKAVALSCYLQGVQDGVQVVQQRPTLLAELDAITHPTKENCDVR